MGTGFAYGENLARQYTPTVLLDRIALGGDGWGLTDDAADGERQTIAKRCGKHRAGVPPTVPELGSVRAGETVGKISQASGTRSLSVRGETSC